MYRFHEDTNKLMLIVVKYLLKNSLMIKFFNTFVD